MSDWLSKKSLARLLPPTFIFSTSESFHLSIVVERTKLWEGREDGGREGGREEGGGREGGGKGGRGRESEGGGGRGRESEGGGGRVREGEGREGEGEGREGGGREREGGKDDSVKGHKGHNEQEV